MKRIAAIALICGGQAILPVRTDEIAVSPRALYLATRSFYGQRCGIAVDLGSGHKHGVCHLKASYHPSSGRTGSRTGNGGWHDAGDYGRYVVNSGITVATLLWSWELFPESFAKLKLDIPESANATPDLLDEVAWNLRWMLSMQDSDGGVWHKQTSEAFPPFEVRPEDDETTAWVIGKSSCATASLAATAAMAARVYERYDRDLAQQSRDAAQKAWRWVRANPDVTFVNPPGITTGAYGDKDCRDELLWAAVEVGRTTGDETAHAHVKTSIDELLGAIRDDDPISWSEVGALAAWRYSFINRHEGIVQRTVRAADAIVARAARHRYRVPMNDRDYVWGSNAVALNYGVHLLVANELKPDPRYVNAARDIVRYILGNNALGISFVTGIGSNSVRHPHHRPSASDDITAPWPGLLAGGPNARRNDDILRALPQDLPPDRVYVDDARSFAGNEIAINWNAALVFVLAGTRNAGPASSGP